MRCGRPPKIAWTNGREGKFVRQRVERAGKKSRKVFRRGGKGRDSCSPEI